MSKIGRPRIKWQEDIARTVQTMSQYGIPVPQIAAYIRMDVDTMYGLYRAEMDRGKTLANTKIGERLYQKAIDGDTTALIFWAKTRMGWREVQRIDHTSSDGSMATPQTITVRFIGASNGKH